jgi:FAD-linked oxidoreductase
VTAPGLGPGGQNVRMSRPQAPAGPAAAPLRWRNWARTYGIRPARVAAPDSTEQVAAQVRRAAADGLRIRMAGTGHSFTPVASTDGVLLEPGRLTGIRSADAAAGLVTVAAGTPLRMLNTELARRGLALANMGDIQVQTVAGAIQTGTHGTGRDVGGMAAQVAGLELVLADGRVVTCSASEQAGGLFGAARIGLGALGVLTAVTFRVVPAFLLHAQEEPMRWAEVISRLDEFTHGNEHFEFYWFPHTDGCLVKRNNTAAGPAAPLSRFRRALDDEFLSNTVFGLTCALGRRCPPAIPVINGLATRALGARSYTDAAYQVFTSPRRVRFKEQEYAIPRELLPGVLAEIRALFARRDWRISFPIEVRVTPADDVWLSTAYQRDSAYLAMHVYWTAPHEAYFADLEAIMTAAGGRPHWGKMHTRDAGYLSTAYPRFADFVALRDRLDPERRFGNRYLATVLGS